MALDRRAVLAGEIVALAATDASRRLGEAILALVGPGVLSFAELTALRRRIAGSAAIRSLAEQALVDFGCSPEHCRFDPPRLRAVAGGGHRDPAAVPAYAAHRDSWFANPRAQVNLWFPLDGVSAETTCVVHPAYFARPVRNSSAAFDLDSFEAAGGFGAGSSAPAHHPTVLEPFDRSSALPLLGALGEAIAFAGAQLHETLGHDSRRTRLSFEIRIIDERDAPPPNVDDACRGSTLPGYLRIRC